MIKRILKELSSNEADSAAINQIAIKSSLPSSDVARVLTTLYNHIMQEYVRQKKVYIPFLGEVEFDYKGDETTDQGLVSIVDTKIKLSSTLSQDIARVENEETPRFITHQINDIIDNIVKGDKQ